MRLHTCPRGLDVPVPGEPGDTIEDGPEIRQVGILTDDYPGTRLRPVVEAGDRVRCGQEVCRSRGPRPLRITAPAAGVVSAVHTGAQRALISIVIDVAEPEAHAGDAAEVDGAATRFEHFSGRSIDRCEASEIRALLRESGLWTALRARPFGWVPAPESEPAALFVTAIDTNPLAPDPEIVLASSRRAFDVGLSAVSRLTSGPTYLCVRPGSPAAAAVTAPVSVEAFEGPHPAGTAGFHIHTLTPVGRERTVWYVGYQDVVAIGRLFETGRLDTRRVVGVGGGPLQRGRLFRTRAGASARDLVAGLDIGPDVRLISGSFLSGSVASGRALGFLRRYDTQLSLLREGGERVFLDWLRPGLRKFSLLPVQASRFVRPRRFAFDTSAHGARRPMVPLGAYERVMPFDILPTFLLRALLSEDDESAEALGCLELIEEDLALCSFVDPGKTSFGPLLRRTLDRLAGPS